ncbi:hypothetical protein [Corynebacterium bovis]|uniref:hypothetical protein n=1 Tax=Corynebacterium bovis TaxID=36808 RepID=UPI000F649CC9|nr:hypothetical protein [Corynebacterium bovis]
MKGQNTLGITISVALAVVGAVSLYLMGGDFPKSVFVALISLGIGLVIMLLFSLGGGPTTSERPTGGPVRHWCYFPLVLFSGSAVDDVQEAGKCAEEHRFSP